MSRPRYDRTVPSDGATHDSPFGPVDPVAVERVLTGHPARLTRADSVHLTNLLDGSRAQAEPVAAALGQTVETVLQRVARRRRTAAERETAKAAALGLP